MPSSKPKRLFIGWDRSILTTSVDWLWQRYQSAGDWQLSDVTVVFPGRRAQREFTRLVRDVAAQRGASLHPPQVITVGSLPEQLYKPQATLASDLEQTLAWCSVLRGCNPSDLSPLVASPPPPMPIAPWLELAGAIRRLQEELGSEGYRFGDVAEHLSDTPQEASRWRLLDSLSSEYTKALELADRADALAQRQLAVENGTCKATGDVVIIGAVDLNESVRRMIEAVGENVTLLVGAPEDEAHCFDDFGCVVSERWMNKPLKIEDALLAAAGDAEDQAIATGDHVLAWQSEIENREITIGITDEAMIAEICEQLLMSGVETHAELGEPLIRCAPGRLLVLINDYIQTRSFAALSGLVRHADVSASIDGSLGGIPWLMCLDRLRSEHFSGTTLQPLPEEAEARENVGNLISWVEDWLKPLFVEDVSFAQWCESMKAIIAKIYEARLSDLQTSWKLKTSRALGLIDQVIDRLHSVADHLNLSLPSTTIMEMLLAQIADTRLLDEVGDGQVELVGWLDLSLDTSKAMCVVGLNEPFVPESVVADPFLPGGLRGRLGLSDNDTRFARDAYALSVIVHSRPFVRLIVGRSSTDGSPTPPSRLLAACAPKAAARRIRNLLGPLPERSPLTSHWFGDKATSDLPIPGIANYQPPTALSVTAFGDYLRCPYRFYLRHIAKLRPLDDAAGEMAANQFGNLVHDSLEEFGLHGPKHSTILSEVSECLLDTASSLARRRYGEHPSAPVRLQIKSALQRLEFVARHHVLRAQQGWLLWAAERTVDEKDGAFLNVDGVPFGLKGRIDRIDHHEDSDMWAVIDYKTHSFDPFKKHFKKSTGEWTDLQLPLYRHMIRCLGVEAEDEYLQLGYFNIGEKEADIKVNVARFSQQHFASADEAAMQVVRGVREGHFPMNPDAATAFDDYSVICQTGIIDRLFSDEPEDSIEEVEA